METSNTRILSTLLLDVIVSLVLFIIACTFADVAREYLPPNFGWAYSLWFAIGMLPFCFYARYRGVFTFNRWDIVAYSPIPVALGMVHDWLAHPAALLVTAVVLFTACGFLRRLLPVS